MNAKQRRKVYRAMPKVGSLVEVMRGRPRDLRYGRVEGRKLPEYGQWGEERNNVPSIHRIRIRLESGGVIHPHTSRVNLVG